MANIKSKTNNGNPIISFINPISVAPLLKIKTDSIFD
jgi:hypothetical protein